MLLKFIWLICKVSGWSFNTDKAIGIDKYVLLGVPHTSNWDFLPAVGLLSTLPFRVNFVIKSEWTKFPMSLIMKPLGAVGINRAKAKDSNIKTTDILAQHFASNKQFALGISPEGSRSLRTKWKSGFYFIALKAQVPILLATIDHKNKITDIGKIIHPSGDYESDMREISNFYKLVNPKIAKNYSLDSRYID